MRTVQESKRVEYMHFSRALTFLIEDKCRRMLYLFAQRVFGTKSSAASWLTIVNSLKETALPKDDLCRSFAFGNALMTGEVSRGGVEGSKPTETRVSDVENKEAIDLFFWTKWRAGVEREPDEGGLCTSAVLGLTGAATLGFASLPCFGETRGVSFLFMKWSPMLDKACKPPTEAERLRKRASLSGMSI